ncbi:MAG: hypothetical protein QOF89_5480 [Acidobacteriota bacterium]|jgi:hypothetical protein|nr:hypothetical protein [Acidobacteriota bacterium]
MRRTLYLGLALALLALPALADNTILAGSDVFQTAGDGTTYSDLTVPAGFFCTTSAALSAHVAFTGVPLATSPADVFGATDTVIERLGDTTFDASNTATVNAIVRAVSFKSTAPVTVSGCSGSALWDIRTTTGPTQSVFSMTIHRASSTATGGTFDASVVISPRLTFTQQGSGVTRTLDESPVSFSTAAASWTHQPGSGGVAYTAGSVQVDTDGNGVPDTTVPKTSNFAAGWSPYTTSSCATAPCPSPISHQDIINRHLTQPSPKYCTATTGTATASKALIQQQALRCMAKASTTTTATTAEN